MPDAVAPEFIALQQAVIGRYSLERELGRGGMGIVFLARDVALDRPVAIKLLPPALAGRPGLKERFLREAQTAAKLSQPNIVPIHAVEERAGLSFFVMSYVDGETLGERLRTRGPLTPHEAARVMREVAWALGYAHGRGVVHRDIKPDNVMLERGTGRAVVMDFGIAALAADARGEVMGTAEYISPEQANGETVDGRADLYSLGVVTFLALTGRLPFDSHDPGELLAMHITKPAPPVASVMPGLPRRLGQAVDRCLAKQPSDRFPDGEALAECVEEAIEPKRQLPVPVRFWLSKNTQEMRLLYIMWYAVGGAGLSPFVGVGVARVLGPFMGWVAGIGTYVLVPITIHTMNRVWRLRRLLEEGYAIEDARVAARDFAERRKEEIAYEFAKEPRLWAKVTRWVMIASGTATLGVMLGTIVGIIPTLDVMAYTILGTGWTFLGTGVLQTMWPGKNVTRDRVAEWRVKFWVSKFGRWFEKIARLGLKRTAAPAELTYRPTELAIGLAADALFAALPKEQRKDLRDLPELLDRLQRDAQLMRRTVDELNGAIDGLGEQSAAARSASLGAQGSALTGTREKLRQDLTSRRDEAQRRLTLALEALENLRLQLLRLRAGTGSVAEVTSDLSAARIAQNDVAIAAAAQQEVEALLAGARSLTGELRISGAHNA